MVFLFFLGCFDQNPKSSSMSSGIGVENNSLANEGSQVGSDLIDSSSSSSMSNAVLENKYSGTCPMGLTNDYYPGSCGKYIDETNDGICDRSQ